ncbi:hypothetical protein QK290_12500 [Pseudarthrobacter sp. AL07]|uniref:hypothetical protein n=1 Tax=unclassified Pseudarthrobacter TaxID=2647000 RepID=UPI00249AB82E|nr:MULTISPECIES: hypothetical protein [unclassified Pseudarthrobacter]MDI3195234.1 hypothetical protein [Pseudarthrobacter sp. AL20]MDI3209300.1 hypothetical protein [Pseudarthrobacter sp. AL07]
MNTVLIALAGTAAAIALTWFFCLRPMRRAGTTAVGCFAAPAQNIDERIRAAREELAQLQSGHPGAGTDVIPPPRRDA